MSNMPLLTMITFLPAAGAVIIMLFMKKEQTKAIKGFATAVAVLDFLISLPLWFRFDQSEAGFQFVEKVTRGINKGEGDRVAKTKPEEG